MGADTSYDKRAVVLSKYAAALIPLVAALLVVAWRPWWLGFYHDDWWMIARGPDPYFFTDFSDQASRPLYFLLVTGLKWLLPPTPLPWHILLAVLVIGNAALIGLVGRRLTIVMGGSPATACWAGSLGAAVWLCCPWALGATAWVTPAVGQVAIGLFCLAALVILSGKSTFQKLVWGGGLLALAYLINELFWFAFVPLLFAPAVRDVVRSGPTALRPLFLLSAGLLAVQAMPIALNRGLALLGVGINRSFNAQWTDLVLHSLRLVPTEINRAVIYPSLFWTLVGALGLTAFGALAAAILMGSWRKSLIPLAGIAAIVIGCLGSLVLFALAGYRLEAIGLFSRSFITFSVWISWVPAVLLALLDDLPRWVRRVAIGGCIALIALMGASTIIRLRDWRAAWEDQQAIIAALPIELLKANSRPGSFIVVLLPERTSEVEGIEAFWDMTGLLTSRAPDLVARLADPDQRMFATAARTSKHRISWDGSKMTMAWCPPQSGELWSLKARNHLLVWDAVNRRLSTFDKPVAFGCGIDPPSGS